MPLRCLARLGRGAIFFGDAIGGRGFPGRTGLLRLGDALLEGVHVLVAVDDLGSRQLPVLRTDLLVPDAGVARLIRVGVEKK